MNKLHCTGILLLTLLIAHIRVPVAAAHPLGNFTINHYAGLHITRDSVTVDYVLDYAEIPAFQAISAIDANRNGKPDAAELEGYAANQCQSLVASLQLRIAGGSSQLTLASATVDFPPGAGNLLTLRLNCLFSAPVTMTDHAVVDFRDNVFPERLGWREIVVTSEGVAVAVDGDFATTSVSQRLTAYPDDLLSSPLDQRQVSFTAQPALTAPPSAALSVEQTATALDPGRTDAFTELIRLENLAWPTILLALAIAFAWGGMHAMTPGHGKTIVGAYLVGSRGTVKHALYLGLATTITHTAGVFALGLVTLFASQYILPEKLFPWLNVISGVLVVGLGANLLISRARGAGLFGSAPAPHDHGHGHDHDHSHDPDHDHVHDHDHDHSHGEHMHSHLPPGVDGAPVTWRSLLALGISGGLLPCPSALVVMLGAIALGRIGFGLALVVAFSLGLAGVLTLIGVMFVYAGKLFQRFPAPGRLLRYAPIASALFITLAGMWITVQAVTQLGWLQL